jgi:hypothetical protein
MDNRQEDKKAERSLAFLRLVKMATGTLPVDHIEVAQSLTNVCVRDAVLSTSHNTATYDFNVEDGTVTVSFVPSNMRDLWVTLLLDTNEAVGATQATCATLAGIYFGEGDVHMGEVFMWSGLDKLEADGESKSGHLLGLLKMAITSMPAEDMVKVWKASLADISLEVALSGAS